MEATTKTTAEKLQEVITAKTMESISKPEAKETKSPKAKKATKKSDLPENKVAKSIKKATQTTLMEEVVTKREVKYIYPEDCIDTLSRKKHRQAVRHELHRLELEMLRIEDKTSKEYSKKQKEYQAFRKKNLKAGATA